MAESSITWADGALLAIDQRALPRELRWLRITTVDELIDAIKTLAIRGAPALGVAGAFGVALAAFAHAGDTEKVTLEAARIASARPTAVNLAWGVRRALATLPAGAGCGARRGPADAGRGCSGQPAVATHAADLVLRLCPDRPLRMLTHCNTGRLATTAFGTALGALRVLHARGKVADVLVDETRPLLQGARLTAWELAEAGIAHRLTIDSAAAWAMATGQVDCVIVGADRITADGSVANKIGTYALALAAHRHGIPFIVVAPESTRDLATATGAEIVVEERAAVEITHVGGVATAPDRTAVFNPAFDVTPPELITAVVTENGAVGKTADANTACGTADCQYRPQLICARLDARHGGQYFGAHRADAVITGSGLSKGELTADDMVTVTVADSQPVSGIRRPSAETAIHTAIYRATNAGAVVHVHSPHATGQSVGASRALRFSGYELIKGLGTAETIDIPVLVNHSDVSRIGADIEQLPGRAPRRPAGNVHRRPRHHGLGRRPCPGP